ncbi:MAG: hypothetical protein ABI433_13280, partial [Burkholderiaceae bacterium]
MKTVVQPLQQPGFSMRQIHIGHADLGKSGRRSPLAQVRQQRGLVQTRFQSRFQTRFLSTDHLSILLTRMLTWRDE